MKKYRIEFKCSNGFEGEEYVYAANRVMAYEVFADLGYENVTWAEAHLVIEEEE